MIYSTNIQKTIKYNMVYTKCRFGYNTHKLYIISSINI